MKKDISDDEKARAIKISQALGKYFAENPGHTKLRSTEVYQILVTKKLVERDRHQGFHFRQFLHRLKDAGALGFIPECKPLTGHGNTIEWHFQPNAASPFTGRNLRPISSRPPANTTDLDIFREEIKKLPVSNRQDLNESALKTKQTYHRAYEIWTDREIELLINASKIDSDSFHLSEIFQRQPHIIKEKLAENE